MPKNKVTFFDDKKFTPTKFSTVEDKRKFCVQFVKFVESGFAKSQFPKWFYTRLSMCFSHIAHYNQDGFYGQFFDDQPGKEMFMVMTMAYPCYGDSAWTFCDAEKYIQEYFRVKEQQ